MKFHIDSESLYYIIAAAATIFGLVYKFTRVFWRGIKNEYLSIKEDRRKLNVVFQEVTCNHGSSIKDKVNALEAALRKNTELTEQIGLRQGWIMEHQEIPIFETDENGLFVYVNEEFARRFGKSANLFFGNGWKNIVHPEDRERVEQHWDSSIKNKIDSQDTFKAVTQDETIVNVRMVAKITKKGYIGSLLISKQR